MSRNIKQSTEMYAVGREFWDRQEATDDGVMRGGGFLSPEDIIGSLNFLELIEQKWPGNRTTALDCGAGIGRVSRDLLLKKFSIVDLVEPSANLLDQAKLALPQARNFFNAPLQEFTPLSGEYDVIWNQWVLQYLTDEDLIEFLQRCKFALKANGVICFKEIISRKGEVFFNGEYYSYYRSAAQYRAVAKAAGLEVELEMVQRPWPNDNIVMFACRLP